MLIADCGTRSLESVPVLRGGTSAMPLGIHPGYLIILLAIVLIIFGPGKLPEVGGAIGRGMREFQKTRNELTDDVRSAISEKPAPPAASVKESATAEFDRPRLG